MPKPIRVLLVEDEFMIAMCQKMQLADVGYEVVDCVSRGEDAVNHAIENHPDIILMDIQLKGGMNGIDAAKKIQEKTAIPLIYLTANADEASFQKAKETKPYAFISKPFNKLNLERTIELVAEKIKEEKIRQKVAQLKERQDESVLQSIREYEEFKEQMAKDKAATGLEKK